MQSYSATNRCTSALPASQDNSSTISEGIGSYISNHYHSMESYPSSIGAGNIGSYLSDRSERGLLSQAVASGHSSYPAPQTVTEVIDVDCPRSQLSFSIETKDRGGLVTILDSNRHLIADLTPKTLAMSYVFSVAEENHDLANDIVATMTSNQQASILSLAVERRNREVATDLLNFKHRRGSIGPDIRDCLSEMVQLGWVELVHREVELQPDLLDYNLLLEALSGGVVMVDRLLKLDPTLLQQRDDMGNSILHEAVAKASPEVLQFLSERYPDLSFERNKLGMTPLHSHIFMVDLAHSAEDFSLRLRALTEPNNLVAMEKAMGGDTILHLYVRQPTWGKLNRDERVAIFWELLTLAGNLVDDSNFAGKTVLHSCVENGTWALVRPIIASCSGIVDWTDNTGRTALDYLLQTDGPKDNAYLRAVALLQQYGAPPSQHSQS